MARFKKWGLNPGVRVVFFLFVLYLLLKFAVKPPLPYSVLSMYMLLALVGAILYLTLFFNIREVIVTPVYSFLGGGVKGPLARGGRYAVLVAMPLVVWVGSYEKFTEKSEIPLDSRVIHPAPPGEFSGLYNPYRVEDKETLQRYIEEGKKVFYQNCVFCHGDKLDGNGIFAPGFNPKPANFQDPTTIAMLQESFLFWRISTGGIGLPNESTPWNSAMPRWETMLTDEQRWKVILFLYNYTGYSPRTWE